eukprot:NODE_8155_length_1518_cov_6.639109.p1 GENE.NODE_8155_length_1518_cov_6.639109~~NODE_8155_length_1518_cov_6.639109.p1  ORF type:complete len:332 (-),score=57.63 NODE_8155_length_1518_cov_6.639109:235-1230(-)
MTLRLISWSGNKHHIEADERLVGYLAEKGKFVLPSARTQWDFWRFVNLITLQELERSYVKDDAMVLELEVHASEKKEVTHDVRPFIPRTSPSPFLPRTSHAASGTGLASDFAALLRGGENSDLKLRLTGCAAPTMPHSDAGADHAEKGDGDAFSTLGELNVHRIVLAARSPVFAQMLFNPVMREAASAELDLPEMCYDMAQIFLQCVYTDEIDLATWDDEEALCQLLAAVHKFQMKSLISRIAARVASLLTEQCACDRLMMADLLDIPELRTKVLDFLVSSRSRLSRVQATASYKRLGMQRPQLLMEILARVAPPEKPRACMPHELSRIVL